MNRKVVTVEGEGEVAYDRLVIGTGFNYADPGVPGGDLGGLYYVKNIRAAMEWDKVLDTVKRAVVVHATPLGLEMVTALAHRGIETHVIDPNPWAMAEVADPDIMAPVQESWAELGVHMHFNTDLQAFLGTDKIEAVKTSAGDIPVDLAVVATHKVANNALAVKAGLKAGATGGLIVDERMATSAPDVCAAGDVRRAAARADPGRAAGADRQPRLRAGQGRPVPTPAAARAPTSRSTCRGAPRPASG